MLKYFSLKNFKVRLSLVISLSSTMMNFSRKNQAETSDSKYLQKKVIKYVRGFVHVYAKELAHKNRKHENADEFFERLKRGKCSVMKPKDTNLSRYAKHILIKIDKLTQQSRGHSGVVNNTSIHHKRTHVYNHTLAAASSRFKDGHETDTRLDKHSRAIRAG